MTPSRPRYARINKMVDGLLLENNVHSAPVLVETIARNLGATIAYRDFDEDVSGLLVRQGSSAVIGVAKNQSQERQRFTIAHELGHLLLHEGQEVHVDKLFRINFRSKASSTAEDVQEIEANTFAANLLMPRTFLIKDAAKLDLDFEDQGHVQSLALRYEVSAQAMTFRLLNLFGYSEAT
jgi:Zn-dependent peptidase ImmA (M78 family)